VARLPLDLRTPNTITERAALEADLADSIPKGYFVTRGENVVDVMGLATTADVYGEIMGIAIAGPLVRLEAGETELAAQLLSAKARLEALGGGT
jgi:DNA-binding IclR family transcriptional regulator